MKKSAMTTFSFLALVVTFLYRNASEMREPAESMPEHEGALWDQGLWMLKCC